MKSSRTLMAWRAIFLAVLLGPCLALPAEEKLPLLKVGKQTYTNVTVTSVSATDIVFLHSRGLANAKLKDLEPSLQAHFHYDPVKAGATEQQQADANARFAQAAREARTPPPPPEPEPEPEPVPATPANPAYAKSFLNQPAPTLVVQKWLTDQPDLNGKFVLIDFWATWCPPCRGSIPHLNQLAQQFSDRLVIVGLSDEREEMVRKMTTPRIEYPVAIDSQRRSITTVGVRAIPYSLLIDPKGIVRYEGNPGSLNGPKLQALFEKYGG